MKARIVANPISGGGRSLQSAERIGAHLLRMGYEVSLYRTQRTDKFRAARWARWRRRSRVAGTSGENVIFPEPPDLAVVVGGDGTVNLALNALQPRPAGAAGGQRPALAVVPTGTANVLARELGLPRDLDAICRLIESRSTVEIDTMLCGERRFLLMAGAGFDAEVARLVGRRRRGRLSFLSYGAPLVTALRRYRPRPICVELDGRQVADDASLVIVTNVAAYGGPMVIAPHADPADGRFDVCIIRLKNPFRIVTLMARAIAARKLSRPEVEYLRGRRVALSSPVRVPLQVDGDFLRYLPATVEIARSQVTIVAPRRKEGVTR